MNHPTGAFLTSHHIAGILRVADDIAHLGGSELVERLRRMVERSGLTAIGELHADLVPHGASCVVLLTESHVAVHTWPEHRCLTVDIHVCDYMTENLGLAKALAKEIELDFSAEERALQWHTQTVRELNGQLVASSTS